MRRARLTVENLEQYEAEPMGATSAWRQAAAVEAAMDFMFVSRKLAPARDAALSGILVPLIAATRALKANAHGDQGLLIVPNCVAPRWDPITVARSPSSDAWMG